MQRNSGTSQFKQSQNISPQILVTFKIKNLATHNCAKDWNKVDPGRAGVGKPPPPDRFRVEDAKFVKGGPMDVKSE